VQNFCDPVIAQPATFYSKGAFQKLANLNSQLHYAMDYEWWLKSMFLWGDDCVFIGEEVIASFRIHEGTKTSKGNADFVKDMASILYSLAVQANLKEYPRLLENAFEINKKYVFEIPPEKWGVPIIERMIVYFLLKWKSKVYTKNDFFSSKIIFEKIKFHTFILSEKELLWFHTMKKNSQPSSWFEFRAKRKLQHLLSK
jgi:hypothetical protein